MDRGLAGIQFDDERFFDVGADSSRSGVFLKYTLRAWGLTVIQRHALALGQLYRIGHAQCFRIALRTADRVADLHQGSDAIVQPDLAAFRAHREIARGGRVTNAIPVKLAGGQRSIGNGSRVRRGKLEG